MEKAKMEKVKNKTIAVTLPTYRKLSVLKVDWGFSRFDGVIRELLDIYEAYYVYYASHIIRDLVKQYCSEMGIQRGFVSEHDLVNYVKQKNLSVDDSIFLYIRNKYVSCP